MTRSDVRVVFRSGLLHEADLVADSLERAGIPFYRQVESASGLVFAMPVAPAPGPGVAWLIVVPTRRSAAARKVIRRLPVTLDPSPGFWGFHPRAEVKTFYRQYAWLYVIGVALVLLWTVYQLFRK
jgi:hypothetical protein